VFNSFINLMHCIDINCDFIPVDINQVLVLMCSYVNLSFLFLVISGLSPDEKHISPIESYDNTNTISRLYSYLSASEGEGEMDAQDSSLRGKSSKSTNSSDKWSNDCGGIHQSGSSVSISSQSESCSPSHCEVSDNDELDVHVHSRTIDRSTLGSSGGENLYSRINEACKY
jgi:hypothetical protein